MRRNYHDEMGAKVACGLLVLGGCESILGLDPPGVITADGPQIDAVTDAEVATDTGDAACVFDGFNFCNLTPGPPVTLTTQTIDTGQMIDCGPFFNFNQTDDNSPACLIYVESLTIDANAVVTAIGTPPLIIASRGAIEISGTLDTKANANNQNGVTCDAASPLPALAGEGAGGGGGGGFGAVGGRGGTGEDFNNAGGAGGATRSPIGTAVRGGCRGGNGGAVGGVAGGTGGSPGGGVRLIAQGPITISGSILANGSGGGGGNAATNGGAGGGGGGSGGYIRIGSATEIIVSGRLAANGGGGGGGGGSAANGMPGQPGNDDFVTANGGPGAAGAAEGGSGGTVSPAQKGYDSEFSGGGGGGGGAGRIIIVGSMTSTGTVSPAPQPP